MAAGTVLAMTLDTPRGPVSLEGVVARRDTPGIAPPSKSVRHGVHLISRDWATALPLGHLVADLAGGRSLPEGARMAWKEIGPYRGHLLWVRELPTGDWLVGVVPERAGPAGASDRTSPPEDRVLPEAFGSEVAATAAAMQFLDRQQERRNEAQG